MSNYTNKIIKEHTGVLVGSVQTHDCDPQMDCKECGGTGTCQECHGRGETDCHTCHGDGRCTDCHGRGRWTCDKCGGSGNCRRCHGTGDITCSNCHGKGQIWREAGTGTDIPAGWRDCPKCGGSGKTPCPDCRSGMQTAAKALDVITLGAGRTYGHGSGKCSKCGGSGEIVCKTCHGTGDCKTCHGTGQLPCEHCHGSGDCPKCNHGKVTCERCEGSGYYQTFIRRKTTLYSKDWTWAGSSEYSGVVATALGVTLHDGPVKTWKNAKEIESDNIASTNHKCEEALGDENKLYTEFLDKYAEQDELKMPNQSSDKPYAKTLNVQKVPVTKIAYTINDENYEILIIGNNHIVAAKSVPTIIKGFEQTKWQKIKLAMTEKKRIKAFARLAAYIFQCDGKSKKETAVFEAMIKALNMGPADEAKFRSELEELNSTMPYSQLRKMIKPLFKSKKTITFAWQCMAVDKQVTPEEEELFNHITAEYDLSSSDIEHLKRLAPKFAKLKNEQIAKEYADLSEELAAIRKKVWKSIFFTIGGILSIIVCILCYIFVPKIMPQSENTESSLSANDIVAKTEQDTDSLLRVAQQQAEEAQAEIDKITEENKGTDEDESVSNDQDGNVGVMQEGHSDAIDGDYPEGSLRLLTDDDLSTKSKSELKIMRNEIFARHGYIFKTPAMKAHFANQSWYHAQYADVSSKLSSIERKNVALIKKYENR